MKHVAINVYQDTRKNPGMISVGEALASSPHLKHAGTKEMQHLLQNPDKAPMFLKEKQQNGTVNALLFGGTIEVDTHNNQYITALYFSKHRGLVTERYWLSYPLPENLCFATKH